MKKNILISLITLFVGFGITMNHSISNKNKVKNYLDSHITKSKIPGIQYIVMDSSRIIFEYMGGWSDIKNKKPMKSTTTMMAYSMTKTITAAAVLQLINNGKLNLDDSIELYLQNNPYGNSVKIKHLLTQTSGIPNPIPLKWVHLAEIHSSFDEEAALTKVLGDNPELSFEPSQKYKYSNISYWLLGKIIELVSGSAYEEYVIENILTPLGIAELEMSFEIPDLNNHAKGYLAKYSFMNLIKGFLIDKKLIGEYEGKWLHINNHYLNGSAFGGLVGTAHGFGKFLQDQLKENSILFDKKTKELFFTQYKNNDGELVEMTFGWHVGDNNGRKYFFKEGGGGGYHSEMRIYPNQGIASIILVNKTNFNSKDFLNQLDSEF